ncbi:patatin-like phospholipase family protein [Paenarthrobacter ureafaciens]|uniref:patatin-like phospholipase family protein n=1 Tax=Paenarthrobacter ureafaciens TaxID=37931 RepID=UPI001FB1AD36|nr:patatin-like phospholipase family protein [Paenarthrobacter ureafaciens]UOD80694.1 patatin-like phospholipase family protein [Paenarthrobacter ureafaciens]WNZ03351.1 patatin-like phospholipase family protein [Paenarthrobacter ureafaciens]
MNTTLSQDITHARALVLGGGGSTGNAWLIGVVAGLADAGLDVTNADLTIGTSAGSTAAAQISGAPIAELYAATVQAPPSRRPAPADLRSAPAKDRDVSDHMERTARIIASSADPADMRRRMGAAALELQAALDPSTQERWRATVAARLPRQEWPQQQILITAVDAGTGEPVEFGNSSGVDLVDAVAASCASGFAYRIGSADYIDGGYRSNAENADLAAGFRRVLVLSPFGGRTRTPVTWKQDLASHIEVLRAGGSQVETIFPAVESEHLFGANAMDFSLRPAAAMAGFEQGKSLASGLSAFWNGPLT